MGFFRSAVLLNRSLPFFRCNVVAAVMLPGNVDKISPKCLDIINFAILLKVRGSSISVPQVFQALGSLVSNTPYSTYFTNSVKTFINGLSGSITSCALLIVSATFIGSLSRTSSCSGWWALGACCSCFSLLTSQKLTPRRSANSSYATNL